MNLFIASAKILRLEGSIPPSSLYGSGVDQWNEERRRVHDFLLLPKGFESFPSDLPRVSWLNLVRVEYLLMVKSMVVGFCSIGV